MQFWYSGAKLEDSLYHWSLATQRLPRASVRKRLTSGPVLAPMMSRVAPAFARVRKGGDEP